ncbi:MAG: hypothetical protein RLZZ117_1076, partial [Cyanobacteriota bacterium]
MKDLLLEVLGWLGYLERPAVVVQLLVSVALIMLTRIARRHHWLGRWPTLAYAPLGLGALGLTSGLLHHLNHPYGLARLLGQLWLGWFALTLLHRLLGRWMRPERVHQLESRLLRPTYLLVATLLLISELDSLRNLAVVPLGSLFGVPLTAGKLFQAGVIVYVVLVGCGPPAAGLAWLVQRAVGFSDGSRKAMELILRYAVVGIGLVAVALHLGLNTTALIAVAGGLSVGLGFGIKEVFSNFVSGIWLLFEGSVRPGEVLMLDGDPCEVR